MGYGCKCGNTTATTVQRVCPWFTVVGVGIRTTTDRPTGFTLRVTVKSVRVPLPLWL